MKKLLSALVAMSLALGLLGADAANDILLSQRNPGNTGNIQRNVPAANAITSGSLPSFRSAIGLGTGDSPQFTSIHTTGVNTYDGSALLTAAAITITANAGPLDITLGSSIATNNADTTINMSALGSSGQRLLLYAVNSDASNLHTWTINNVSGTDPTFTAAANTTTVIALQSDGTGFSIVGGPPTIIDLSANTTPASTNVIASQNTTTGATTKSTLAQIATATGVLPHSISFTVTGGGSPLTTGVQDVIVNTPYGGTLTSWSVTASPADTITFDILRSADGGAAPSSSIVGGSGTKPNLASGVNGHSTTFTSWTSTTVTAYDNFKCQITAVGGTATAATVTLFFQ